MIELVFHIPFLKFIFGRRVSITINNEIAQDIIESIGAIIINCQEGVTNKSENNNI